MLFMANPVSCRNDLIAQGPAQSINRVSNHPSGTAADNPHRRECFGFIAGSAASRRCLGGNYANFRHNPMLRDVAMLK
jgi:hypothetical protein